jgi:diguanylate cyclase (GGDEF)-like protein
MFAAANLTASYHIAGISEFDVDERRRLFEDGLVVAASVLDRESSELEAEVLCRAHRSAMLAHTGRYDEALRDADTARAMAAVHAMRDEELVAMSAQCIARWRGQRDRAVLQLVVDGQRIAEETASAAQSGVFADLRAEILWSTARHDEARDVMVAHIADLRGSVRRHMAARWAHVRQAIDARRSELLHETDPLTGLGNETFLHGYLDQELGKGSPVCIAVIDLDQFRELNDAHGYPEGDRVLQEVARVLERVSRRGDTVVRLGGDEFAMVLRDISVGDARHVLERVRQLIAARRWDGLPDIELTVSIGLTVGADVEDAAILLGVARDALQDAKRDGRNRIAHR